MILRSSSGYCMPFEEPIKQDVQMSLGYGEQKNPVTGETFFHHGIDFSVNHYLLSAVATGTVSAIGSDAEHGIYQTIRYGKYEVTYRHLSNVFANFSQSVKAGQTISLILSVYWPLITCIYFIWSFLFHSWSTSWLIWPLASVVRHLLYSVLDTIEKEQKKAEKSKKA